MTTDQKATATRGVHYLVALAVLLALTGTSFALSQVAPGGASHWIALAIAAIKVAVVGTIFMHLREAIFATRLVALVVLLFIAILCFGVVADVALR